MIYKLAYELNEELLKSSEVLKVKNLETKMNNNEEFIRLIISYDTLKSEIQDLEKYGLDTSSKQKELYDLKLKIDSLEVVKEYRKAYKETKEYLKVIAKKIFNNIDEEIFINEF